MALPLDGGSAVALTSGAFFDSEPVTGQDGRITFARFVGDGYAELGGQPTGQSDLWRIAGDRTSEQALINRPRIVLGRSAIVPLRRRLNGPSPAWSVAAIGRYPRSRLRGVVTRGPEPSS